MPLRVAEAFILQTHPLREADKIVSYFTRDEGKRRGIAFGARRSRARFGARLEPLTRVRVRYFEREGRDLDRLDNCELIASPAQAGAGDDGALLRNLATACMVEIADRMLPERQSNETVFRLLASVSDYLRGGPAPAGVWLALTYYLLWMVRLGGFLPDFERCAGCGGRPGAGEPLWRGGLQPDLYCGDCRGTRREALPPEARALAAAILHTRVDELAARAPEDAHAAGWHLRRLLLERLEDHIEAALRSWPVLADLEPALNS